MAIIHEQKMKNGNIHSKMDAIQRQLSMMYRQIVFLDTRLQAFESVLGERFEGIQAVFFPAKFMKRVDAVHVEFMRKHDENLKKQIEDQKKPSIQIISPNGFIK